MVGPLTEACVAVADQDVEVVDLVDIMGIIMVAVVVVPTAVESA